MNRFSNVIAAILSIGLLWHAVRSAAAETPSARNEERAAAGPAEQATFGLGCFWCAEAVFEQLRGVTSVDSGYSGGSSKGCSYKAVSSGRSGLAEVVQLLSNRSHSYDELWSVWKMLDRGFHSQA